MMFCLFCLMTAVPTRSIHAFWQTFVFRIWRKSNSNPYNRSMSRFFMWLQTMLMLLSENSFNKY